MNRELVNAKGEPVAQLKRTLTQMANLVDMEGNAMVSSKLQLGVKGELSGADGKPMGSVKMLHVQVKHLVPNMRDFWGVESDGHPYIYMLPVEKAKLANVTMDTEISLATADDTAYRFVKGDEVVASLAFATGGLNNNFYLFFEKGTNQADRLLCTTLAGYQIHNLLV